MQMVNDKLVASHQNILKTYSQGEFSDFRDLYSYDFQLGLRAPKYDLVVLSRTEYEVVLGRTEYKYDRKKC